jgi:hypothetical protein
MTNVSTRTVNAKEPREEVFKKTAAEKQALRDAKSEWKKSQKANGSKA